jgi:hypothetical protein
MVGLQILCASAQASLLGGVPRKAYPMIWWWCHNLRLTMLLLLLLLLQAVDGQQPQASGHDRTGGAPDFARSCPLMLLFLTAGV